MGNYQVQNCQKDLFVERQRLTAFYHKHPQRPGELVRFIQHHYPAAESAKFVQLTTKSAAEAALQSLNTHELFVIKLEIPELQYSTSMALLHCGQAGMLLKLGHEGLTFEELDLEKMIALKKEIIKSYFIQKSAKKYLKAFFPAIFTAGSYNPFAFTDLRPSRDQKSLYIMRINDLQNFEDREKQIAQESQFAVVEAGSTVLAFVSGDDYHVGWVPDFSVASYPAPFDLNTAFNYFSALVNRARDLQVWTYRVGNDRLPLSKGSECQDEGEFRGHLIWGGAGFKLCHEADVQLQGKERWDVYLHRLRHNYQNDEIFKDEEGKVYTPTGKKVDEASALPRNTQLPQFEQVDRRRRQKVAKIIPRNTKLLAIMDNDEILTWVPAVELGKAQIQTILRVSPDAYVMKYAAARDLRIVAHLNSCEDDPFADGQMNEIYSENGLFICWEESATLLDPNPVALKQYKP